RNGKISFFQQPDIHNGIVMIEFPKDCDHQRRNSDYEKADDEIAFEPVQPLTTVKNYFQRGKANRDQRYSYVINLEFAGSARRFHFTLKFRRVRQNPAR